MNRPMPGGSTFWSSANNSAGDVSRAAAEAKKKEPTGSACPEERKETEQEKKQDEEMTTHEDEDEDEEDDEVFTNVKAKVIRATIPESPQRPTICMVPGELAEGHIRPYAPAAVCIGPFFLSQRRKDSSMAKLESYKWCCVRRLIVGRRSAAWKTKVHDPLLRRCLDTMRGLVPRIRACYSFAYSSIGGDVNSMRDVKNLLRMEGAIDDDSQGLARMMLLDGCFVLHRLLKLARRAKRSGGGQLGRHDKDDDDDDDDDWTQVYGRCWVWDLVVRDLLLLNNQIPLFVIQALVEILRGPAADAYDSDDILINGGLELFQSLHPPPSPPMISCRHVHHLLHLYYSSITNLLPDRQLLLLQGQGNEPPSEFPRWVPSAKELEEAGVTLRARNKEDAASFLDVRFRFRGGVLEIPPLELYDYSEPLFRNLIAFEQTFPDTPGHVTAYAIFMDCLIRTHQDLRLLHHSGILLNHMNAERNATHFFSRVCAEAHAPGDRNYLARVMRDVVRYQGGTLHQWRAALKRDYFSNPWVTTTVLVTALVLALTALQTFYTVYAYHKPPS